MSKKRMVSWALLLGSLVLVPACDEAPRSAEVIDSHVGGEVALLIEREGGSGPYVEGTVETFRLAVAGERFKSVRWSTDAGAVEPDADRVAWRLPTAGVASLVVSVETESGKKAEGRFQFSVVASSLGPVVIPSGSDTTSDCKLEFDLSGAGHVVYANETHRTLWYGAWDGTTWRTEQVDGPGFKEDEGYIYSASFMVDPASGTPHIAYLKGHGNPGSSAGGTVRVVHATRVGNAWRREFIDGVAYTFNASVRLALDPSQGGRPVVLINASGKPVQMATRTAPGVWSLTTPFGTTTMSFLSPDMLIDASGALYLVTSPGVTLRALRGGVMELLTLSTALEAYTTALPMVQGESGRLLVLLSGGPTGVRNGMYEITPAAALANSTVKPFATDFTVSQADIDFALGRPALAVRRETALEVVTPDADGYWLYTQLGSAQDNHRPSVAINPATGNTHVCYRLSNKVTFQ
ncbi:hypothetical protein LZ198_07875 [Myxococcus sp. K15C18031901]|uniref:hypothetical protein n=1 Tax=Myxococcus dinghuensis TaxID=2906761 RepID=UPI0020A80B77|nr:hypothetical protein [Myxococcus dinghuensis]MCP3098791.1 hypothetical protein [Myxococcus dinghuensis]